MGERCTFKDDDDCSFSFSYKENPGKDVIISVQKEKGSDVIIVKTWTSLNERSPLLIIAKTVIAVTASVNKEKILQGHCSHFVATRVVSS